MKDKTVADSKTVMTEMVMPNDTNPLGNLMGGNLMRWMDIAGGVCAGKHCESYVVTASVDHVSFRKPIRLGDVVTIKACVTRAWTTSVEVYVEVFAAELKGSNPRRCNDAFLTFVGVDDNTLKPKAIPGVLPLTGEEQLRFESAQRRRELRLVLGGRMQPDEATNIKALFVKD